MFYIRVCVLYKGSVFYIRGLCSIEGVCVLYKGSVFYIMGSVFYIRGLCSI